MEIFWEFLGGFFGRNALGGIFREDFLDGFFGRNFLFKLLNSAVIVIEIEINQLQETTHRFTGFKKSSLCQFQYFLLRKMLQSIDNASLLDCFCIDMQFFPLMIIGPNKAEQNKIQCIGIHICNLHIVVKKCAKLLYS